MPIANTASGPSEGRWDGAWLTVADIVCILGSRPFVEMGLIDDFSYVRTAFVFGRTGHLVYNGWATAMLGWQVIFGGIYARLFGYTFLATRMSTLTIAAGCVWLTHAVLVRMGVNRRNAIFGTLTACLSPLFVPMSITFMTDIAGVFVIVACLYLCLRALAARTDGAALGWLIVAAAVGMAGGTARQIAFLGPLVMVPSTAWVLRRRPWAMVVGVAGWALTLAVMFASLRWFKMQPYNVPEPLVQGPVHLRTLRELAGHFLGAWLCLGLLAMPVLTGWWTVVPRLGRKTIAWILMALPFVTGASIFITRHGFVGGVAPWAGDVMPRMDILDAPNAWFIGVSPVTFNFGERLAVSVVVLFTLMIFAVSATSGAACSTRAGDAPMSWREIGWLLGPFTIAYFVLLMPRGLWADVLDRYLLPLVPVVLVVVLRMYQERVAPHLPAVSYVALAMFAGLAIAGTHDWTEGYRARLASIERMHAAGVSSSQIQAGYEYDGITQIDNTGIVIDKRVAIPDGIAKTRYAPPGLPAACTELFNEHTPSIHAEFFLAYQKVPCLADSQFGSVMYRAWLPPFERKIAILKLDY